MTSTMPEQFHFPQPPFRIDRSLADSPPSDVAVASYLHEIGLWRSAVLELTDDSVATSASEVNWQSKRARDALATFLASSWSEQMTQWAVQTPYHLTAFPARALDARSGASMDALLEVLRWRAGVVDCLSDIWDVFGDPELDIEECSAIGQFLRPRGTGASGVCAFCLTEFGPDELHPGAHQCLLLAHVRAKWPPTPPSFARWGKEARTQASEAGADRSPAPARAAGAGVAKWKQWWEVWRRSRK